MNVIWFWALAAMFTAYSVLDGYDLGAGALHCWLARSDEERRLGLNAIGPVWNGNEVWLIAGGGMLVVSFPRVYADGFSGFYLPLMVMLWLLIGRGVAIEFRGQIAHAMWRAFWDACLAVSSLLIALLLGVALGNVIRGVPLGAGGTFQGTFALLLNPYALLTGMLSLATLLWHGANYIRVKTEGAMQARARRWSAGLGWLTAVLLAAATAATLALRSGVAANFFRFPAAALLPAAAVAALAVALTAGAGADGRAFRGSSATIAALLGTAAATVFPDLLRSTTNPAWSLTVYNAAAGAHGLRTSLLANVAGMAAVIAYSTYVHRIFRGKVRLDGHGY